MMRVRISSIKNKFKAFFLTQVVRKNQIYIGYIGRDNFGDDLLFDIYDKITGSEVSVAPILDAFHFQPKVSINAVLGGGTVIGGDIYAKAFRLQGLKPSRVFCAGVIPGDISQEWIQLLSNAEVYTRSSESCERLNNVGLTAKALVDPAIFCKQLYPHSLHEEFKNNFVLAVHGKYKYEDLYELIIPVIKKRKWINIVLFASSPEDISMARLLSKKHGGEVISGWKNLKKSISIIASARAVISTRLHPAICAASFGTPVRLIAYDEKHKEFSNSIKSGNLVIDPLDDVVDIVESLLNQSRNISDGVSYWHESFDEFCELFQKPI